MPVRYTCRLVTKRTPGGKIRIVYDYLGNIEPGGRLLTIKGPAMVVPPDREFTDAEFDRWEFEFCCGTGYGFAFERTPVTAPLVEAAKTIEDEIPKGSVAWKLLWACHTQTGAATLAVELKSSYPGVIPSITLSVDHANETPQPVGEATARFGAMELGASFSFFERLTTVGLDTLPPNYPVGFALDPQLLPQVRSRAVALSPESHWIALRTEGHEFDRIPGAAVATFLETEPADGAGG